MTSGSGCSHGHRRSDPPTNGPGQGRRLTSWSIGESKNPTAESEFKMVPPSKPEIVHPFSPDVARRRCEPAAPGRRGHPGPVQVHTAGRRSGPGGVTRNRGPVGNLCTLLNSAPLLNVVPLALVQGRPCTGTPPLGRVVVWLVWRTRMLTWNRPCCPARRYAVTLSQPPSQLPEGKEWFVCPE